ncbi:hypothetical protein N2152v2_006861 [Parachlorella kessleri]
MASPASESVNAYVVPCGVTKLLSAELSRLSGIEQQLAQREIDAARIAAQNRPLPPWLQEERASLQHRRDQLLLQQRLRELDQEVKEEVDCLAAYPPTPTKDPADQSPLPPRQVQLGEFGQPQVGFWAQPPPEPDTADNPNEPAAMELSAGSPVAPPPQQPMLQAAPCVDLDMWFLRVRHYLAAAGITDDRLAIRHAVTLFGAVPLRWWQALAPNAGDMPFSSWEEFTTNVRLAFPGTLVAAEARQRLYSLSQRPSQSFGGYLGTFQAIASRIPDLSEAEKMHCLLRGVLPSIRAEILRVNPQTFTAQVAVAAQAAAILGMRKVGKPWTANPHPRDSDPVPMELGQLSPKLTKTKKQAKQQQSQQSLGLTLQRSKRLRRQASAQYWRILVPHVVQPVRRD